MFANIAPASDTITPRIAFGGSRSYANRNQVVQVIKAVLQSGAAVSVGCAIGADALVITAVVGAGRADHLRIYAAFGASGAGAWAGSAVSVVMSAARAGAAVIWLAGGAPGAVPLRARLAQRSAASLTKASAAVFFMDGDGTPGSLNTAALAVKRRIQVFAFCAVQPRPLAGCAGNWQPCQFANLAAWQWLPAQLTLV
jgi:hypothetical protein